MTDTRAGRPPAPAIEFRLVAPDTESALTRFFADLVAAGDTQRFQPHPFTADEAHRRAHCAGADLYYLLTEGPRVLGYGMLRGWDEGYDVPSLGIVIHPAARGRGLGRSLMHFLHAAARARGARRIRLKVRPDNAAARRLYESLGYVFAGQEKGELVGYLELP